MKAKCMHTILCNRTKETHTHTTRQQQIWLEKHDTWCSKSSSGSIAFHVLNRDAHTNTTKTFYLAFDDKYIVTFFIASLHFTSIHFYMQLPRLPLFQFHSLSVQCVHFQFASNSFYQLFDPFLSRYYIEERETFKQKSERNTSLLFSKAQTHNLHKSKTASIG